MLYKDLTKLRFPPSDLIPAFKEIERKILELRDGLNLPITDARTAMLNQMHNIIVGFATTIIILFCERDEIERRELFTRCVASDPPERTMKLVGDQLRLSFIVLFHFKLHSLFQDIIIACNISNQSFPKTTFFEDFKSLINSLELEQTARSSIMKIVTTLSNVRNSMHNNGIHRGDFFKTTIKDLDFEFVKNASVECASFGHIFAILDELIDGLGNILRSKKVRDLTRVEDLFIELNPL